MKEIWKDVPGYEGLYKVSNLGRVISLDFHNSCKPGLLQLKIGFDKSVTPPKLTAFVTLCKNGIPRMISVHRLVAMTFIPNPDNLPEVHHKDKNRLNNKADNLMWVSRKEHAILDGKCKAFGRFDKNNKLIKIYYSTREVVIDGFCRSTVMSRLHSGEDKLYKDSFWKYL